MARRSSRRRATPSTPPTPAELPAHFRERMAALLGDEADAFFAALLTPGAGLRVNTLRIPPERFAGIAPFDLSPLPYPPDGFVVGESDRPGSHPYHQAGLYYLQDPGAMTVGAVPTLPPNPLVLDLAAAPGGKATHLAARMAGQGVLVANDVNRDRARELAGNLERCGVRNAIVTVETPARLAGAWGGRFDLVVVDAPCSGESMFHKSEAARREWSPDAVAGCARRQVEIVRDAARLVRPGGLLLYATCTFAPEENEGVVADLLRLSDDFQVEPLPDIPGAEAGRPDWVSDAPEPAVAQARRLWPHRTPGAGHFLAALRRGTATQPALPPEPVRDRAAEGEAVALLQRFLDEQLPRLALPPGEVVSAGDELYLLPTGAPPLAGLRVLRPGWWLGTARKGRIDPAHALAMGLQPGEAAATLDLPADSAEAAAYLRGETVRSEGPPGWVVVTVDGFPLGWGKRTGAVVKNHLPKGLRRR